MNNYKELKVWQKAVDLAEMIYQISGNYPKEEKFGLISQLRRAAISVASNIAEGAGRNTDGEFRQMLGIAYGSICEVETQLILSDRMAIIDKSEFEKLSNEIATIQKMLYALIKKLS
ncbi:MAG TPA: four helix bundle protein [Roseivirga sp.]